MTRPAVLVLSRWTGYCLPCNASDRPLVLVWSGPADLRTRLLGPPNGTGTLRLTCGLCGGTDVVGWEDEHVDEALLRDEPVEEVVRGALAAPLAAPLAVTPAAPLHDTPVAAQAAVEDGATAVLPAEPGDTPTTAHLPVAALDDAPGLDLLGELIGDDQPTAPAWQPPLTAEPAVAEVMADETTEAVAVHDVPLPRAAGEAHDLVPDDLVPDALVPDALVVPEHVQPGLPVAWDEVAGVEPGALWQPVGTHEATPVELGGPVDASGSASEAAPAWDAQEAQTAGLVAGAAWDLTEAMTAPEACAPVDQSALHVPGLAPDSTWQHGTADAAVAWEPADLQVPGLEVAPTWQQGTADAAVAWEPAALHVPGLAPDSTWQHGTADAAVAWDPAALHVPGLEVAPAWQPVPAVEPDAPAPEQPDAAHVPVTGEPAPAEDVEPAWVPTLSADVAAALRELAGPAALPAPRSGEEPSRGLVQHG